MKLGAFLVLLGVILCGLALLVTDRQVRGVAAANPLLAVGVMLIGIGVLVGHTELSTS